MPWELLPPLKFMADAPTTMQNQDRIANNTRAMEIGVDTTDNSDTTVAGSAL